MVTMCSIIEWPSFQMLGHLKTRLSGPVFKAVLKNQIKNTQLSEKVSDIQLVQPFEYWTLVLRIQILCCVATRSMGLALPSMILIFDLSRACFRWNSSSSLSHLENFSLSRCLCSSSRSLARSSRSRSRSSRRCFTFSSSSRCSFRFARCIRSMSRSSARPRPSFSSFLFHLLNKKLQSESKNGFTI